MGTIQFKRKVGFWSMVCNIIIVISVATAVFQMLALGDSGNMEGGGPECFRYYTVDSNILIGIASLISIFYNIRTLRTGDGSMPLWLRIFKLSGVVCVTITMLTVIWFLGPVSPGGYGPLFAGCSLTMHLTTPLIACGNMIFLEGKWEINRKKALFCMIPTVVYGLIYIAMAIIIGEDNGGWPDFYMFNIGGIWPVIIPVFLGASYLFSVGMSYFQDVFALTYGNYGGEYAARIAASESRGRTHSIFRIPGEYRTGGYLAAIDAYNNKVFKWIVLIAPVSGLISAAVVTASKLMGLIPSVSTVGVIVLDWAVVAYLLLSAYYLKVGFKEDGTMVPRRLKEGKILITVIIIFHWNFYSYLIPGRDFWGYSFFFAAIAAFFFDYKMMDIINAGIGISTAISWLVDDRLLPLKDQNFGFNLAMRIVCMLFSMFSLHMITYFAGKSLIADLEKNADYDPLTRLLNRRKLPLIMDTMMDDFRNGGKPLAVVILDIDNFKKFNDTYGHEFGDAVLKTFSETLSCGVQREDRVIRWGGEEVMILIRASREITIKVVTRLVREVAGMTMKAPDGSTVGITCTAGFVCYDGKMTQDELFEEADKNLYIGKHNGKNTVVG